MDEIINNFYEYKYSWVILIIPDNEYDPGISTITLYYFGFSAILSI